MKWLVLILVMTVNVAFGQDEAHDTVVYYDNGNIKSKTMCFSDTMCQGIDYYLSGKILSITTEKFDTISNHWIISWFTSFHENGIRLYSGNPNLNPEKEVKSYYDNGQLQFCLERRYVGIFDGKYLEYYPDGQLKEVGNYKWHKKIGVWKYYNEEGIIEKVEDL